ncbi:MAG: MarC family protein [Gemmatimonadales bacterium]
MNGRAGALRAVSRLRHHAVGLPDRGRADPLVRGDGHAARRGPDAGGPGRGGRGADEGGRGAHAARHPDARRTGAISTAIVVAGQARGPAHTAVVYAAIVLTGGISYVCLRLGEPLLGRLGKTGIRVVTRVMGLILAAVAVQFAFSGVREAFGR